MVIPPDDATVPGGGTPPDPSDPPAGGGAAGPPWSADPGGGAEPPDVPHRAVPLRPQVPPADGEPGADLAHHAGPPVHADRWDAPDPHDLDRHDLTDDPDPDDPDARAGDPGPDAAYPDDPDTRAGDPGPDAPHGSDEDASAGTGGAPPAAPVEPDLADLVGLGDLGEGDRIIRLSLWLTVLLGIASFLAAAVPDVFVWVSVPLALFMFVLGCVAFLWAYGRALRRSRTETLDLAGLTVLAGPVAPARVKRWLRTLLAAQVVISVAAAAVRPYTPLAFGVLAPMAGLGLMALWAARHGTFPPKAAEPAERVRPEH